MADVQHSELSDLYNRRKKGGAKSRVSTKATTPPTKRNLNPLETVKVKLDREAAQLNQIAGAKRFEVRLTQDGPTAPKTYKIFDLKKNSYISNYVTAADSLRREMSSLRHSEFMEDFINYYGAVDVHDMTDLF